MAVHEIGFLAINLSVLTSRKTLVALSLFPAFFLAVYVAVFEGVPPRGVLKTFVAAVILAGIPATVNPIVNIMALGTAIAVLHLVIVPIEEITKLVTVGVFRNDFSNPYDGAAYGAAAGLGFALLENIFYISDGGAGIGQVASRSVAASSHVMFTTISGYYLGTAQFQNTKKEKIKTVAKGLTIAVFLHLTYNYIAIAVKVIPSVLSAVVLLGFFGIMGGYFVYLVEKKSSTST